MLTAMVAKDAKRERTALTQGRGTCRKGTRLGRGQNPFRQSAPSGSWELLERVLLQLQKSSNLCVLSDLCGSTSVSSVHASVCDFASKPSISGSPSTRIAEGVCEDVGDRQFELLQTREIPVGRPNQSPSLPRSTVDLSLRPQQ